MDKRFNSTGVCIPSKHYMVDIKNKIDKIKVMIDRGDYFVINRPRQYGKTTTMFMLEQTLKEDYLVISISFEGVGDLIFNDEKIFSQKILEIFADSIEYNYEEYSVKLHEMSKGINDLNGVSKAITSFCKIIDIEPILFIDEVDKSSNNQVFLSFLGMLRNKFLLRQQGKDRTFHSVILVGVYDIKNLKLKIRQDEEKKYNSPWNIAVKFNVDMSFTTNEIADMLEEYSKDKKVEMDVKKIAQTTHYYTSGYPFLVSRICQIIDEDFETDNKYEWPSEVVIKAVKAILQEENTLFDDLIKNIENNKELREYIFELIINGAEKTFVIDNPLINIGYIFGYFKNANGRISISNKIFEQRLYNYFSSKL